MAIENLPLFSAMNREEVCSPFPHPHRPFTSQEAHFAVIEKVNACISEVNNFQQRVQQEMQRFITKSEAENNGFKEAIQASYNTFMQTVQREVNNFEVSSQNNFDIFRNNIDKRVADFETAINNSFEVLQEEVVKASNTKIAEMEELKVSLNSAFNDYKATLNSIVNSFKADINHHIEAQDGKIEEYKQLMVDNILSNTRKIFNEKSSNGEISALMTSVYGDTRKFKGALTYNEIQANTNASNGDYYYCKTDGHFYQRSETAWVDIGNGERLADDYEVTKADIYRLMGVNYVTDMLNMRVDIDTTNMLITLAYEKRETSIAVLYGENAWVQLTNYPHTLDLKEYTPVANYGYSALISYNKSTDSLQVREYVGGSVTDRLENDDFILCGVFVEGGKIKACFDVKSNHFYVDGKSLSPIYESDTLPTAWANGFNTDVKIDFDVENMKIKMSGNGCIFFETQGYIFVNTQEFDLTNYSFRKNGGTDFIVIDNNNLKFKPKSELKYTDNIICMVWYWSTTDTGELTGVSKIVCDTNVKDIFYVNGVKWFVDPVYEINNHNHITVRNDTHNSSDVGCVDYMEIGETDYSQIILYGQSLGMGWEAPEVITTQAENNCYMVGSSPMINHGNDGAETLSPLIAVKWSDGGEQPIVSATNAFAKMYRRFVNRTQKFIGTNCGEGGRSIEKLMKQNTNGTNYYTTEFLETLTRTKSAVQSEGKTVSCSAIIFMQGEYNYTNTTDTGLTAGTNATTDKAQYKAYLKQLKDDMQADIMAQYGQAKKPLFFIYQVAGNYINNKEMTINMAQVEFAQENNDVILLNSTYGMPDYSGGHLSTNGYRWYGELIAKQLYKVFVKGENFKSVNVETVEITGKTVKLCCHVPVSPLVFDTNTKEAITNHGFKIYKNNTEISIASMEIMGNVVEITCGEELTGKIEITYGGYGSSGSGNLRDSDNYTSLYTYFDDRTTSPNKQEKFTPKDKDGNPIYGQHYPLYNWCNQFYYSSTV